MSTGNFQNPGWYCEPCNQLWDRPGPEECRCGKPAQKCVHNGYGDLQLVVSSVQAPERQVVGVYPDNPTAGMLECGHMYRARNPSATMTLDWIVGCTDCWREENAGTRSVPADRNLLMVEAPMPAHARAREEAA